MKYIKCLEKVLNENNSNYSIRYIEDKNDKTKFIKYLVREWDDPRIPLDIINLDFEVCNPAFYGSEFDLVFKLNNGIFIQKCKKSSYFMKNIASHELKLKIRRYLDNKRKEHEKYEINLHIEFLKSKGYTIIKTSKK